MNLIKSADRLHTLIGDVKRSKSIGFVPTMGAIHEGHLSLVRLAAQKNDLVVTSIFVNPTQFNNPADFEKYPVTIEKDINLLEKEGCDILFLPVKSEIYPQGYQAPHYDLGDIEKLLEGKYRPGHFQGVCQVVDRLLQIIMPDDIYLGKKDYQQCMVIKKLVKLTGSSTNVILGETLREKDGLAMSSRNMRLSPSDRLIAREISKELINIKKEIGSKPADQLILNATSNLEEKGFTVDYVSIADAETLEPVNTWDGKTPLVALVAATLNDIRLIDNLVLSDQIY